MIEDFQFGKMTILGKTYHTDLKIVEGKVLANWWRKAGHSVQEIDVDDVLAAKPDVFVVGTGQPGRMHVTESLRVTLAGLGVQLIEEPTPVAVTTFNRLHKENKKVAAAFHLTC